MKTIDRERREVIFHPCLPPTVEIVAPGVLHIESSGPPTAEAPFPQASE